MIESSAPSDEQLERAAHVVRDHASRAALGAFGYDVLSRQAEGGGLFAGEKLAQTRAEQHGLTRADAETPLGNALVIAERGAESAAERALLAAAFVSGFADAVAADPEQRSARVTRFVEHAEWLELRTPYRVLRLCELALSAALVSSVYEQLGARVRQPGGAGPNASKPVQQASATAGRIALLAQAKVQAARDALAKIADAGEDDAALLAAHALGRTPSIAPEPRLLRVRGPAAGALRGMLAWLLRAVTGVALVAWAWRFVLGVLGVRHEVEVTLRGSAITLQRELRWLGRELRSDQQLHQVGALRRARRSARFVGVYRSLATACFALGVLIAGRLAVEAALASEAVLWLWAAGFLLIASALDLVIAAWLPGRTARVTLEVDLGRGARGRIGQLTLAEADAFLAALSIEVERARKGGRRAVA